jgi:hypothetical protein
VLVPLVSLPQPVTPRDVTRVRTPTAIVRAAGVEKDMMVLLGRCTGAAVRGGWTSGNREQRRAASDHDAVEHLTEPRGRPSSRKGSGASSARAPQRTRAYDEQAAATTLRTRSAASTTRCHSARSPTASQSPTSTAAARWASAITACAPVRSAMRCCTGAGSTSGAPEPWWAGA